MDRFSIEIAGAAFSLETMFISTKEYFRPYLTEKIPDFFISVQPEDLVFEQAMLDAEALEEGLKRRKFTDPFLERTAIQRRVADKLIGRDPMNTVLRTSVEQANALQRNTNIGS